MRNRNIQHRESSAKTLSSRTGPPLTTEEASFPVIARDCTLRELVSEMFTRDREFYVNEFLEGLEGLYVQTEIRGDAVAWGALVHTTGATRD